MKTNKLTLTLSLLMVCLLLCACGDALPLPSSESKVTELSGVMTAEEIAGLDVYENLATLDLSGSTCYPDIINYINSHPGVSVTYTVDFANQTFDSHCVEIGSVNSGNYSELIELCPYLPELASIPLGTTDMTIEQITELTSAFPNADISYSVDIFGTSYASDTTSVDLSGRSVSQLNQISDALNKLTALESVNLISKDGSTALSFDEFDSFASAYPDLFFNYTFELFGQQVSTSDTELIYDLVPIGNTGVEEFWKVLPHMKKLSYLLLDCCGIFELTPNGGYRYDKLGQLNADFPDIEVVWRVRVGEYDMLTTEEKIWLNAGVIDEFTDPLKYCTKCRYLDMGHCEITNIDFCNNMPDLEVAIFALGPLESIEPLRNCPKLEYLEIYATNVSDLSPLENCTELQHINFGSLYTIKDISPLYGLTKLKRVRSVSSGVPFEQREEIMQLLPDCEFDFNDNAESSAGFWRRNPDGSWCDRYLLLRQQFQYDDHAGVCRTYKYDLFVPE